MAKKKAQLEFEGFKKPNPAFGGSLLKGNPKTKRPLASKLPIHLTLRARQGGMRNQERFTSVNRLVDQVASKYGVRIYEYANVGNHLHMVIKLTRIYLWA